MSKTTPILTNFTAGELSPQLEGRVDVARYSNAVSTLENFLVAQFGGADRRPGSVFVAPAKYPDKVCRVIPFEFSTIQVYVIEMGEGYFRFFRDNAAITETAKVISGASQADPCVLTITGHGYSVDDEIIVNDVVGMTELNGKRFRVKTVVDPNNIEIKDLDGVDIDSTGFTAYTSGGESAKIYEISNPYVESQLLDIQFAQTADIMYLVHQDTPIQKISRMGDTDWTLVQIDTEGGPYQEINTTATTVTPSAINGTITITSSTPIFNADMVGGLMFLGTTVGSPAVQGYVKITVYTDPSTITAIVQETLSGTGATDDWGFGSFSDDAGYPSVVGFHEQRLYFGATLFEPQTFFGSQILQFENFTPGEALDTDAIKYEIATEQVNSIRWLSSGRGLAIGTAGGAFIASSGADFITLTPTNISVRRETTFGSELIIPKRIGNFLYYIQRGARKLREFSYNFDIDSHLALDMTLLSEQISDSGITVMDFQQSPHPILWCVRADGEIATMTRQSDQEVIAWSRQVSAATLAGDSAYESIASIPKGEEDQIWVSVKREVNSTVRRFIEYFAPIDFGLTVDGAFFVDSGLTYEGVSTTILTGLDHLEGETVTILNEGAVEPERTVVDGSITLDTATTKAHVGLRFISKINTLKLEGGSALGTAQGKIARINEVTFRVYKTVGAVFGRDNITNTIYFRTTSDDMDTAVPLFTGDKRVQFPKGYDREPRVFIQQAQPLPLSVLAIMPRYEVFEQ